MILLSIMLFHPQLKITVTCFFLLFFSPVKLVTYIIIHSNILLVTCIYVLPFIFHCIICCYLFTLWRFNKVNQSINQLISVIKIEIKPGLFMSYNYQRYTWLAAVVTIITSIFL